MKIIQHRTQYPNMTSTFVSEVNKLKNIQVNLEKNEQILLQHLKKHGVSKIVDLHDELITERKKELILIQTEILNILHLLNKYKTLKSSSEKETENIDYKQIKKEMLLLAENIRDINYKTKQCIENFKLDEKQYCNDIKLYEGKIEEWGRHISFTCNNSNSKDRKVDQNITDFLTFLSKTGGHTNGWSSEDHNLFLKARSKCKDTSELCIYLHTILPDISEGEIELHEKWYIRYLKLKENQKQAIQVWRKAKSAVIPHKESTENTKRVASAYSQTKCLTKQEAKEKLAKWKEEKIRKLQNEKILNDEIKKCRKEIDQKNKQQQEDIKRSIQHWKLAKLEKEELELYEKHILEKQQHLFKTTMANRLIKEFQSHDAIFLKRRMESCKPRTKRMDRAVNNIYVARDPARLLKPTKQWVSRIKAKEDHKSSNSIPATIKTVPRLGVPEWRRNALITR